MVRCITSTDGQIHTKMMVNFGILDAIDDSLKSFGVDGKNVILPEDAMFCERELLPVDEIWSLRNIVSVSRIQSV